MASLRAAQRPRTGVYRTNPIRIANATASGGLFETVLEAAPRRASDAKIAVNTRPDDSGDASLRQLF
jgi:hypothetical protein